MKNIFNILLTFVAVLFLSHQLHAASVSLIPTKQEYRFNSTIVKDIKNYTQQHPDEKLDDFNTKIINTLGQREEGDSIVFDFNSAFWYQSLIEDTTHTTYPAINSSAVITYVEISFEGNTYGRVYIADGGIGQSFISIVIVPEKKEGYASYKGKIYGRN